MLTAGLTVAYSTWLVAGTGVGSPGGAVGATTTVLVAVFEPAVLPTATSVTTTFVLAPTANGPTLVQTNAPSVGVEGAGVAPT